MAAPAKVVLTVDVLGYVADGQRQEIEGKGEVFATKDLAPEALERGLETGALVPAGSDEAKEVLAEVADEPEVTPPADS